MPRRVYLINLSFGLAGIERRFANLWRVLHRRGVVTPILVIPSALAKLLDEAGLLPDQPGSVISLAEPAPLAALGAVALPEAFLLPRDLVRSRVAALQYRRVWRDITTDSNAVVHIGLPCSALRPPNVPTVYECVDSTFRSLGSRHYRRASTRRCIVHCQTDRIRASLDTRFTQEPTRWMTVTNPTYFAHYTDPPPTGFRDPGLVSFVGRLTPIKNPLLLIEAIALARDRGCRCRLIILGEGPLRPHVDALVRQHELEDTVSVAFDANAPAMLSQAAVYVSLQNGDNFGSQALLEAMGAGCAVIASDVGETARIVTDEVGVRVPLTPDAVAGAVAALVGHPERTQQMGAAAARIARTVYSADAYAAFLESLYERAVEYHRAADHLPDAGQAAVRALR